MVDMKLRIYIVLLCLCGCLVCASYPYPYGYDYEITYPYRYSLYTLNQGDGTMSVIPLKVNESFSELKDYLIEPLTSVAVGNDPVAIAFKYGTNNPDLYPDIALILNRGGKDIACFDPDNMKVTGRIPLPSDADPIGMTINKGIVYVADRAKKRLFISNTFNQCSDISFDSVGLSITPAAIASGENTIYVIDESGQSVLPAWGEYVSTFPLSWGFTVTDIVYAGHKYREHYLYGYGGYIPEGTYVLSASPRYIYYLTGDSLTSTSIGDSLTTETSGGIPERIFISPDGNYLFVTFQGSGNIWGYGLSGGLAFSDVVGTVAFLPSSNMVFISRPSHNSIIAHTLRGNVADKTINIGASPGEIAVVFSPAIAPNRKAY